MEDIQAAIHAIQANVALLAQLLDNTEHVSFGFVDAASIDQLFSSAQDMITVAGALLATARRSTQTPHARLVQGASASTDTHPSHSVPPFPPIPPLAPLPPQCFLPIPMAYSREPFIETIVRTPMAVPRQCIITNRTQLRNAQNQQEILFLDVEQTFKELQNVVARWNDMGLCREAAEVLFRSEGRLAAEIEQALSSELLNIATLALAGTLCVRLLDCNGPVGEDDVVQYAKSTLADMMTAQDFVELVAGHETTLVEFPVRLSIPMLLCHLSFHRHRHICSKTWRRNQSSCEDSLFLYSLSLPSVP